MVYNVQKRCVTAIRCYTVFKGSIAGREKLENHLEVRRAQEDGGELKNIRRGWCLGGETFRQELLEQARKRTGDSRVAKLKVELEEQNEFNLE
jgi:hypothetical protein